MVDDGKGLQLMVKGQHEIVVGRVVGQTLALPESLMQSCYP